jgi:ADP-dependent NAD(P)H-hydrate dehydratase / NAD(P)H-hydrate epimerase
LNKRLRPVRLPHALYRAEQVRGFDQAAIASEGITELDLMARAGQALFDAIRDHFPQARRWLICCGVGNNGGDGQVLACLAQEVGIAVEVIQLGDPERLRGAAQVQFTRARQAGIPQHPFQEPLPKADLIVDGLLGIGLDRAVSGPWLAAIEAINRHPAPVVAIDIPSGLHADSGRALGAAVRAQLTVSFIGLKQGLLTADGPEYCGRIRFARLAVPDNIFNEAIPSARRLDWHWLRSHLSRLPRTAHKGDCGHLLVIGGAPGMPGAVRLAGEAALRSGAGLVSIATHPQHASGIAQQRPELMCQGVEDAERLRPLLRKASMVVLGPGLGTSDWSLALFEEALTCDRPRLLDADGLNLLAQQPRRLQDTIITPHPGEAARLLGCPSAVIQGDRFAAAEALRQGFAPVVVLKGAGTLIAADGDRPVGLCSGGNPGMASAGMGDVLSGIIAALAGQGLGLREAAELGVALHAEAADRAARRLGERGLLASDLIAQLPLVLREAQ